MPAPVRLIAALDFGTHGTGFAWAFASERDRQPEHRRIHLFDNWAGQPTNYVKNLTSLLLDASGDVVSWGYQALRTYRAESQRRPDLDYVDRFKMGLLDSNAVPPGRSANALITAYLREFYRFALEKILLGSRVAEDEIGWCLTVPAIWRDAQRDAMRVCAEAAGFPKDRNRLRIAVEPEVAALSCRYDGELSGHAAVGRRFMVVDAGGGTIDITAYEESGEGLGEIGYTSGGSHGATYVDARFYRLLGDRLGPDVMHRAETLEPGALIAIRDEWERAKRGFDPAKDQVTSLPISFRLAKLIDAAARDRLASAQDGIDDEITLSREDMVALFDHVVPPILGLVEEQLRRIGPAGVDSILLVGGFAQSRYLQTEMIRRFGGQIPLVVPGKPSWAVLLGAVHYGLEPERIVGRRARFTYGVGVAMPFDTKRDPAEYRIVDSDNIAKCGNRLDILVSTGAIVAPGTTIRRTYVPVYHNQQTIVMKIYTATRPDPRYTTEDGCEPLAELSVDVSDTVGRPSAERVVEATLTFGGTELDVRAVNASTGEAVATTVSFERRV